MNDNKKTMWVIMKNDTPRIPESVVFGTARFAEEECDAQMNVYDENQDTIRIICEKVEVPFHEQKDL